MKISHTSAVGNHKGTSLGISFMNKGKPIAPNMFEIQAVPNGNDPVIPSLSQTDVIESAAPTERTTKELNFWEIG